MIFHYIRGGALMCEIRIPGLTIRVDGWTVNSSWRDRPTHPDYVDYSEEDYYEGYKYFVAESMTREAAQRIVDSLGGYLVPNIIPPSHQLGAGGPFVVHRYQRFSPQFLGEFTTLQAAIPLTAPSVGMIYSARPLNQSTVFCLCRNCNWKDSQTEENL